MSKRICIKGISHSYGDSQIALNPNFNIYDNKIYFNLGPCHRSRHAADELYSWQVELFEYLHEQPRLDCMLDRYPDASDCFKRWWEMGIIEFISCSRADTQSHLVVIEPHIDDAILSVGGALLRRRAKQKITVVSNTYYSNYTCYHEKTTQYKDFVTLRRSQEGRLACQLVGATHLHLDQLDKPLRWLEGNGQDLLSRDQLEKLAQCMLETILPLKASELWIPLASGSHSDHHNTRNAAILMLQLYSEEFSECVVNFYEDQPYVHEFGSEMRDRLITQINGGSMPDILFEDITNVMDGKKRLVGVFGSQFKSSFMTPSIVAAAKDQCPEYAYSERRWHLQQMPQLPSYVDFEKLDDPENLFRQLKHHKVINVVAHDYLVKKDIEKLVDEFSPLTLNIFTRERERERAAAIVSEHVNFEFYPNTIDAFYECTEALLSTRNEFCIIAGYQLGQPCVAERFARLKNPDRSYQTLWMSSMFGALNELITQYQTVSSI